MDIVIVADFCGPLDGTYNSRFLYLADILAKDHHVELITSDFNHWSKTRFQHPIEKHDYPITLLHEAPYPKNICLQRFYGHFVWGKNLKEYLLKRSKPDVIYCAIPPLSAAYAAADFCKENGVRFVVDIQDLWPEAFHMAFSIPVISDLAFAPLRFMANRIYQRADEICAVSQTYADRALRVNKKAAAGHAVFLGTELRAFDENVSQNRAVKEDPTEFWVGYCGSMGDSYDLKTVIDAIALLKRPVRLVAMGDGQDRENLALYAKEKGVNAEFTGLLPYDRMCGKLAACDVAVNPIVGKSVASIINKHADYAAAGIPVVNTQQSEEYQRLLEQYHMGFHCKTGDAADMAEKLEALAADSELRAKMGAGARRCAEERFDRARTYRELVQAILKH